MRLGARRVRLDRWATACALAGLAALLALGTWQLDRRQWKQALNAERLAALSAPIVPIARADALDGTLAFRRARLHGRFLHEREVHLLGKAWRSQGGVHVLTPLALSGGGVILVERGFVPNALRAAERRPAGQLTDEVAVEGVLRPQPRSGPFTPANRPERSQWYWPELAVLSRALELELAPLYLEAGATANPGGWPLAGQASVTLPDNHLGYAITWYGLAATLAAVYLAYHWRRAD